MAPFDAALRFGEPEPCSLVARRLLETRVLTCAAPAYLAKHGRPTHPRELGDARHECIHYVDPVTGRPFPWEFHRGRQRIRVAVSGRLTVNNVGTTLGACAAGYGIAQILALGTDDLLNRGKLVEIFPDWPDEAVYALHVLPFAARAASEAASVRGFRRPFGRGHLNSFGHVSPPWGLGFARLELMGTAQQPWQSRLLAQSSGHRETLLCLAEGSMRS